MKKIATFALSALLVILLAPILWYLSLGFYQPAEHWLFDVYAIKERRAAVTPSPRLIIVSGSNALFGFDSATLERLIGMPVVNMAAHAGLPLDFHASKALKTARRSDIVLMPLEFGYYISSDVPTEWEVENLTSWGHEYLRENPHKLKTFFRHANLFATARRLLFRPIPHEGIQKVLAAADANSNGRPTVWAGYNFRSANSWGDFFVRDGGPSFTGTALYTTGAVNDYSVSLLRKLRDALERKGAILLLTWPVTARNEGFDLSRPVDRAKMDAIRSYLANAGIRIICDPNDFHYDRTLFYNTNYHINEVGARMRMVALADCLKSQMPPNSATTGTSVP